MLTTLTLSAWLLSQAIMPGTTLSPDYRFESTGAIMPVWYDASLTAAATAAAQTTPPAPSVVWALDSGTLPPGLSLNPNGTLSGTPTAAAVGTHTFTIRATVAGLGNLTRQFTITIAPSITIASTPPPPGRAGVQYSHQFQTVEGGN